VFDLPPVEPLANSKIKSNLPCRTDQVCWWRFLKDPISSAEVTRWVYPARHGMRKAKLLNAG